MGDRLGDDFGVVLTPDMGLFGVIRSRLVLFGDSLTNDEFATSLLRDFLGVDAGLAFGGLFNGSLVPAAPDPLTGLVLRGESDFVDALVGGDALW